MSTKQFISLENLSLYNDLLLQVMAEEDAKAIKAASLEGKRLNLYTQENPTAQDQPRFSITLPFTQEEIVGANGTAYVWNESDGGGIRFEHNDGTKSFIGCNDGGENGLTAQIYSVKKVDGKNVGTRINVTNTGIYYTNGNNSASFEPGDEIATKKDVQGDAGSKTVYLKDESAGQSEYAKVYKLYQGADASDMSKNTFVGALNIPLDGVVKDGHLVTVTNGIDSDGDEVPSGVVDGTYIKLLFQNVDQAVYINVHDLVDVYTGGATAEITVSIDSNNEITAVINNGSIGRTKLNADVNTALEAGESALQPNDVGSVDEADIRALFN